MAMQSNPRKRSADTQEEAWVADEDRFVLRQSKKKARLRVAAGRGKPIDQLAVTLRALERSRGGLESDDDEQEPLLVNPEIVFNDLTEEQLEDLETGIDTYLALERTKTSRDYWTTMKLVCSDRRRSSTERTRQGRGVSSISEDLDRILAPKTLQQLSALEQQVKRKLQTQDDIDVDYWESLLSRASIHKARAQLQDVARSITEARMSDLRQKQKEDAAKMQAELQKSFPTIANGDSTGQAGAEQLSLDPQPLLKLAQADKTLLMVDASDYARKITEDRQKVVQAGYFPLLQQTVSTPVNATNASQAQPTNNARSTKAPEDDASRTTSAMYEREAARGVGENEEVFAAEEEVSSNKKPAWTDTYRPRKPLYFNRVQMGYEWNKYNQTHYDQDNPPPKVVQGYKFNVFYPDLIDKTKAPTYRIERENGRRRGQTLAPAGEEDTCLIRFVAGPPYEDVAFRIVDKEWDYSAKRERGFRSSFDKGILQLHFQFKKIYYRK